MASRKAPATPKRGRGRPTKFSEERCEQARKLCLLGLIDKELAEVFGVTEKTLNNWKRAHPEFLQAIARGKVHADANVAASLYERACGYSHPDVHVSNFQGSITITPLTKYYPPDTQAGSIWLNNRRPDKWKREPEPINPNAKAIPASVTVEIVDASRPDATS